MAAVETHVSVSGDAADPQSEDDYQHSGSEGESGDQASDEGASDAEADGESDGEGEEEQEEADEEADEEAGEDAEAGEEGNTNAGWAEAMSKILGKKTGEKKNSILVKRSQLDKNKERERQEQLEKKKQVDKRHAWEMLCREKPDIVKDRESERALQRIATRGVVQLFNAVRKHQKTMDSKLKEVGGSERKKAKILTSVSKKDFIDVLRGEEASSGPRKAVTEAEEKPAWSVLREDFMMGASMKDWDRASDAEEAGET